MTPTDTARSFAFAVPGKAVGKGRPRFAGGRVFTDRATEQAEQDIFGCWMAAGSVRLEGPVHLAVRVYCERPQSHLRANGELSAEGLRHPFPDKQKPDVDNALKLVMDALNGRAWRDDVQVVSGSSGRVWGQPARTYIFACNPIQTYELEA